MDVLNEQVTFVSLTNSMLLQLSRSLVDSYIFISPEFKVISGTQEFYNKINKQERDVLNKSIFEVYSECHSTDIADALKTSFSNSVLNRKTDSFSFYEEKKDLSYSFTSTPVFDDHNRLIYISQKYEIASIRTEENIYNRITELSQNGIMAYKSIRDIDNKIIDFECIMANNASALFTGISNESIKGKRLSEISANYDPEFIINKYADLVNNNLTFSYERSYEVDGIQKWFQATSIKLGDGYSITFVDITEGKQTELDLLDSKQKREALFNQTSYFVTLLSLEGKIIESNRAADGLLGPVDETRPETLFWEHSCWTGNEEKLMRSIKEAANGISSRFELLLFASQSRPMYFDFSVSPIFDANKKVIFLIGEGRDISQKRFAEQELLKSKTLLSEAEKIAHYGSWEWDISANKIYWSEELFRIFGYEPYEVEMNYNSFLQHIHSDDRERVNAIIQDSFNHQGPFSFEHKIVQKNGEIRYLLGMGKVIASEEGQVLKMMGSTLDITKQTEVNQQILKNEGLYRTLAKNMPNAVVLLFDQELTITLADGAALNDLSFPRETLVGKNINEIYTDEKDAELIDYCRRSTQGEEFNLEKEVNGRVFKMEIMPVKNSVGEIFAGMSVFQDITDIKQYQKELEVRIDELNKSNEELEQFAYIASHDLQEPLRKIRAFGERLSGKFKDELGEDGKDYVDRMQNAAGRMQILIDDLLAYSRLSRNKEDFKKIDLSETLNEVLNDLEITIEQKKAVIEFDKLPVVMAIDGQMRQLFQNIISNALKFNKPDCAPHIRINVEALQGKDIKEVSKLYKKNKYCRISISDSGIGFDEKYLDRIFVIFQRLHGRSEYAGTGIGLAICKKIVENHSGFITAESKVDQGATFIITLPFNTQNSEQLYLQI